MREPLEKRQEESEYCAVPERSYSGLIPAVVAGVGLDEAVLRSLGLGQLALGTRDFSTARRHLEQALRLDPRMGEAHRALAQVLTAMDDPDRAARHAAFATDLPYRTELTDPLARLRIEPAGSQARLDLGIRLMQRGRLSEAGPVRALTTSRYYQPP